MKILERYILKENFRPFISSLIIITFVMLLDRAIDLLTIIIEKQLDVRTIINLFGLSLPFMMALSIPMAVLMGSIMSFGRLSVDRELLACKACGINVYKLMSPTIISAILVSLFMVHFNTVLLPNTNYKLSNLFAKIQFSRPITSINPGVFNKLKEYSIFARSRDDDFLYGVVIYDNKNPKKPRTITATKAEMMLMNSGNSLQAILYDGQVYGLDKAKLTYSQTTEFQTFTLNIKELGYDTYNIHKRERRERELTQKDLVVKIKNFKKQVETSEKTIHSLQSKIATMDTTSIQTATIIKDKNQIKKKIKREHSKIKMNEKEVLEYSVEYHKKYAIAFACLIFVMIGIPVGMMTKTSGVGVSFSVSTIVFIIYYAMLIGGEQLSEMGYFSPMAGMWSPNFVFFWIGVYLIHKTMIGEEILNLTGWKEKLNKIIKKLPF